MEEEETHHLGEAVELIELSNGMEKQKRIRRASMMAISSITTIYSVLNSTRGNNIRLLLLVALVLATILASLDLLPIHQSSRGGTQYDSSSSNVALSHVKRWCLHNDGGQDDNHCHCPNPLEPLPPRVSHPKYLKQHQINAKMAATVEQKKDIVFLGDSITQHWLDRKGNKAVFNKYFTKEEAELDGLALGVSGDTAPHLLWRLQSGELPPNLESKVFWVLIGTNDFGDGCSDEIVFVGILRIIEELQRLRPESKIVINSLLPRSDEMNVGDGFLSGSSSLHKIWDGIKIVNSKLSEYCNNGPQDLHYFDATDIFIRVDKNKNERIPKELMKDFLHPGAAGYQLWAERISKTYYSIT